MNLEDEIANYLNVHGNTKKDDLIEFGTHNLHLSSEVVKEGLDKMMKEGWIWHIIHTKLKAPAIYVALKEPALLNLQWTKSLNPQKKDKKALREDVRRILDEAAKVAEQRIR